MKRYWYLIGLVSLAFLVMQKADAFASTPGELSLTEAKIIPALSTPASMPKGEITVSATPAVILSRPGVANDGLHEDKTSNTAADSQLESKSAPAPEPATMLLFGTGIAGLMIIGRRRTRKSSNNLKSDWNV